MLQILLCFAYKFSNKILTNNVHISKSSQDQHLVYQENGGVSEGNPYEIETSYRMDR